MSYCVLMDAYARRADAKGAERVMQRMRDERIAPNVQVTPQPPQHVI
jgi:pentatricopeptide repeat protein